MWSGLQILFEFHMGSEIFKAAQGGGGHIFSNTAAQNGQIVSKNDQNAKKCKMLIFVFVLLENVSKNWQKLC